MNLTNCIILVKQYQHTFKNDVCIQLSLSFHFYVLYLILHSCDGNAAILMSLYAHDTV